MNNPAPDYLLRIAGNTDRGLAHIDHTLHAIHTNEGFAVKLQLA